MARHISGDISGFYFWLMATQEMNETPTRPHPETFLSHCARLHLADELGVQADEFMDQGQCGQRKEVVHMKKKGGC